MSDINYDPACRDCRRDAGKDNAGTTWQCASHVCAERDALSTALTYEREVADVLMTRVHERDAEIALLKRELTQERKHTNDYIKALHRAERERDRAQQELNQHREVRAQYAPFEEWAQSYLDAGRWAGHMRADAIKTELLERDAEIERLRAELSRLCDRGTVQALKDANDRAEAAERQRDEAVALLRQLQSANCDGLHHERRDYHGADKRCPILARLDAFLAGGRT